MLFLNKLLKLITITNILTTFLFFQWIAGTTTGLCANKPERAIIAVFGIHQDIGFMDDYETMMRDYRERMRDYLEWMDTYPELTLNWGNIYNLKDFLEHFPGQQNRIKALVDEGRLTFPAQWVDYEPDWTPGEYIIRQVAYPIAYLKKQFGYRPCWCHLLDVPSITPQYAQMLGKSGINMVLLHFNYHNPDYESFFCPTGLAIESETALRGGVYEYVGLDGTGVIGYLGKEHYSMLNVAFGWYKHEFGSWRATMDRFARHFTPNESIVGLKLAQGDEDHGLTPRKIPALVDSINSWNRQSPHADSTIFRFGTVDEFVDTFKGKSSELKLKKYTGQTRPWVWSGRFWERGRYYFTKAVSEVLAAEKFASFNDLLRLKEYPEKEIDHVWESLLWPADHNWLAGTDTDGFKAEAVYKAYLEAREILDRELFTLAAAVKTEPGRRAVIVFNPLNWKRSYPVIVKVSSTAKAFSVQDCIIVKAQPAWIKEKRRSGRTIEFIARDVPALGYKTFYLEELDSPLKMATKPGLLARGDTLENEFYRVVFDPVVGIRSIFDIRAGREMVKPGFMCMDGAFLADTSLSTPLFISRSLRYQGKRLTVKLYSGLDMIDIQITADDRDYMLDLAGMFLPHEYTSLVKRGPELLAAGPNVIPLEFALKNSELTYGVPFGAVPYVKGRSMEHFPMPLEFSDRSPKQGFVSFFHGYGGLPNAVNIVKWLDCYEPSGDYGISLAYQQSQTELLVVEPGVLRLPLYIQHPLENTVLRSPHEWHFVLRGHNGDWKSANAPVLGWDINQPLIARERLSIDESSLPEHGSFLDVNNTAVVVSGIKKSYYGNSYIIHLAEMLDSDTKLELRPGLVRLHSPARINLAEDKRLAPLGNLGDRSFSLDLKGFSIEAFSVKGF